MADILGLTKTILEKEKSELHCRDIASRMMILDSSYGNDVEVIARKVSASLSKNVKRKDAIFRKVPNGKNGFKQGVYKLKGTRKVSPIPSPKNTSTGEVITASTSYVGKAGEYAVFSELLYWEFNPAMVTVDDGIDIIASKKSKYYHIQVKTANPTKNNTFIFTIKKKSFDRNDNSQTFYVLVLRRKDKKRYFNDFIILPNHEITRLVALKVIGESKDNYSISIYTDGHDYLIANKEKVTTLNDFSVIR